MKVVVDIPDATAEDFMRPAGRQARIDAADVVRSRAYAAVTDTMNQVVCTCGHTRFWHGQESAGHPKGSGACDDCDCKTFTRTGA